MNDNTKNFISFLVGMFFGRYGLPLAMHLIYLSVIVVLLAKIFFIH